MSDTVSGQLSTWLKTLYEELDYRLFAGGLPDTIVTHTLSGSVKSGTFRAHSFESPGGAEKIDEITIRRNFINDGLSATCLALTREMIKQWQFHKGIGLPKRDGYFNKEYEHKAIEIGLRTIFELKNDGKEDRWKMDLEIVKDGKFEEAIEKMTKKLKKSPVSSRIDDGHEVQTKGGKRSKYVCPDCGWSCYSKPNQLGSKVCPDCAVRYFKSLEGVPLLTEMKGGG